jgi:glucose-6-phosphate isomerase
MEDPDPQRQMFEEQMRLEREQLAQKEMASERDAEIKREKIDSDERREDLRTAADLQEAEMKHQEEVDKSLIDLTKIAREAREE